MTSKRKCRCGRVYRTHAMTVADQTLCPTCRREEDAADATERETER